MNTRSRIAVLASGRGSNLQCLLDAIAGGQLDAEIVGYFRARVTFAPDWPAAPASLPALAQPRSRRPRSGMTVKPDPAP